MSHQRTERSCTLPFVLSTHPVYEHSHYEHSHLIWMSDLNLSSHHLGITSEPTNNQVRWSLSDVFSKIFCIIILSFWSLWLFYHEELGIRIPFIQLILLLVNINTLSTLKCFSFLVSYFFSFLYMAELRRELVHSF